MRKVADCRDFRSDIGCTLTIAGTEEEVVAAASAHAVAAHGHADGPGLREEVRRTLADEDPVGRYGSVMVATLTGSVEPLLQAGQAWADERRVPGFLADETLVADDGRTVVVTVFFASREEYARLADDPAQDAWWREEMAPHVTDVRWIDGVWQQAVVRQPAPPEATDPLQRQPGGRSRSPGASPSSTFSASP